LLGRSLGLGSLALCGGQLNSETGETFFPQDELALELTDLAGILLEPRLPGGTADGNVRSSLTFAGLTFADLLRLAFQALALLAQPSLLLTPRIESRVAFGWRPSA
jgi:hypothetical protein